MTEDNENDKVFRALASAVRRRVLDALRDSPQTTGELCSKFPDLNRCTVMQHIGVLVEAGLVVVRRSGRVRWNYLNALPIKRIHDRWIGEYASRAISMLDQLSADLDENQSAAEELS